MSATHYTKSHEYVRVEGETGVVGITDYAQAQLGDVVFVELPPIGQELGERRRGRDRRKRQGRRRSQCASVRHGRRGQWRA